MDVNNGSNAQISGEVAFESIRVESRVRDVGVFDESTRRLPSNFARERERERFRVQEVTMARSSGAERLN